VLFLTPDALNFLTGAEISVYVGIIAGHFTHR